MRYYLTRNPTRQHKAEEFETTTHIDTVLALLNSIGRKQKAFVEVKLATGERVEVGRTVPPHDAGKPWTHVLMAPRDIFRIYDVRMGDGRGSNR